MIHRFRNITLYILAFLLIASCKKNNQDPAGNNNNNNNNNSNLPGPTLILTPSTLSGRALDPVSIDYTSAALAGIKKIRIEEQFEQYPKRILKDSTLAKAVGVDDENFIYRIPDSAKMDQKSVLAFTITDVNGKFITKHAEITVTASRPRITVTQDVTTAHPGGTVNFIINVKSSENNLNRLDISASINGSSYGSIATFDYNHASEINTTYAYHVPFTVAPGDHISVLFTASNVGAVTNFTNKSIDIN